MSAGNNWIALTTIWIKECTRFLRIWIQTLVPPAITMSLYFVIFGNLIGERIGQMGGFTYMEFIVPGLIMMSVITNSYANVSSSFFSAKFQRNLEEMLVAPVPTWVIILGYVGGGVARAEPRRLEDLQLPRPQLGTRPQHRGERDAQLRPQRRLSRHIGDTGSDRG